MSKKNKKDHHPLWHRWSEKSRQQYHRRWVGEILKSETKSTIKRHIVRHAKEIYKKNPIEWAASMRNLLEIFEAMLKIKPSVTLKLKKLYKKYQKNPRRYTPPPRI